MAIADLFPDARGVLHLAPSDKDALLRVLAEEAAARIGHSGPAILEALQGRERLGSTALGRGIAMPHARLPWPDAKLAILARLKRPIEFDARDGEPVDLVFLVLWPEEEAEGFLPALSGICRALRDSQFPRQLRQAKSAEEALLLLRDADASHAAGA
jgi:PTS system nitrogen regulatory IIA component